MKDTYKNVGDVVLAFIRHPIKARLEYERLMQKYNMANEVFYEQSYHWLASQLKPNTTVIDIGANIGDTAIYFAQFNEVDKVIAYEPFPYSYQLMLRYLKRCQVKGKIVAKNEAIVADDSKIVASEREINSAGLDLDAMKVVAGKQVKTRSLATTLKGLRNVVIKSDCEGAEEYIFNTEMKEVYAVMFEWHGVKARESAKRALTQRDFKVRVDAGRSAATYGRVGYGYAVKRTVL